MISLSTRVNHAIMMSPQTEKVMAATLVTFRHLAQERKLLMQDHSTRTPYFPENLQDYAPWVAKHGLTAPYGECQCGCGELTGPAKWTSSRYGLKKNMPTRFVAYHSSSASRTILADSYISEDVRAISLTRGMVVIVDAADYEWLNQWRWYALKTSRSGAYGAARTIYVPGSKCRTVLMHRVIMGDDDPRLVDHVDGNQLNNTRANLRFCTIRQNNFNRKHEKGSSSRYKGVFWEKSRKKWKSGIRCDGKPITLGFFVDEWEAAQRYNEAARELFGEFARLNIKEELDAAHLP